MGRIKGFSKSGQLATTEARNQLPKLVGLMRDKGEASGGLLDDAISIGPYRRGGAILLPEVDVEAAVVRQEQLEEELALLRDEVEDLLLMRTLEDLYRDHSTSEGRSVEQVARELGFADLLEG